MVTRTNPARVKRTYYRARLLREETKAWRNFWAVYRDNRGAEIHVYLREGATATEHLRDLDSGAIMVVQVWVGPNLTQ